MIAKTSLIALSLALASLAPSAALADRGNRHHGRGQQHQQHQHDRHCQHSAEPVRYNPLPPSPGAGQDGRYELQAVQKWVPAGYAQVWVPETCVYKPRRNVTRCHEGYYAQQYVPGRYESAQEWVWVPSHRGPVFHASVRF